MSSNISGHLETDNPAETPEETNILVVRPKLIHRLHYTRIRECQEKLVVVLVLTVKADFSRECTTRLYY